MSTPPEELQPIRAPRRLIVTIAAVAPAVAGGSTLADAHDGTTARVAFSPGGDARIDQTLATVPPSPCLAPALLINPAPAGSAVTGTYIAASGA